MAKVFLVTAAISGALAVLVGAFGAHVLAPVIAEDLMSVFNTGVEYHFYHTLALLVLAVLIKQYPQSKLFIWSACLMLAGVIIFSGSLYLLAITDVRWLGAITPIGGVSMVVAWLLMAMAAGKHFHSA